MKLHDQQFGYKEIPPKNLLEEFYKQNTQQEIANKLGTTKTRVKMWLDHHNIETRPRGAGNNEKYHITKKKLYEFIKKGHSNKSIAKILGCSSNNIHRLIHKYELQDLANKIRWAHITEYKSYCSSVYSLTNKIYNKNKNILNPLNKPRRRCGIKEGYQIDHIKPIRVCFIEGLSVEECSSFNNLQFISWEANLEKRKLDKRKYL